MMPFNSGRDLQGRLMVWGKPVQDWYKAVFTLVGFTLVAVVVVMSIYQIFANGL